MRMRIGKGMGMGMGMKMAGQMVGEMAGDFIYFLQALAMSTCSSCSCLGNEGQFARHVSSLV